MEFNKVVPSTKTLYIYIHHGLLEIMVIDLPRAVRIRKKVSKRPFTKKHLGKSIKERKIDFHVCFFI